MIELLLTIFADVKFLEVDEASDGRRDAGDLVITQAQLPYPVAVKQLLQISQVF